MAVRYGEHPRNVRLTRTLVVAVTLLLAGNVTAVIAHDDGVSDIAQARTVPPATAQLTPGQPTAPEPTTATSSARQSGNKAVATTTTAAEEPDESPMFPLFADGYDYEVVVSPVCAKPGQTITATLKLKPKYGATGTVLPFYSDGTHEQGTGQLAAPDGTVTYTWVAKPVPGEGRLVTQGRDPDTGEVGSKVVAFWIHGKKRPC